MGLRVMRQNVIAVRGKCTVKQSYTYLIMIIMVVDTFVNMTRQRIHNSMVDR